MAESVSWAAAPIWAEWLRTTRLMWGAREAFLTERQRWTERKRDTYESENIQLSAEGSSYETSIANHIAILADEAAFHELVMFKSWALMEGHAKLVSWIVDHKRFDALDAGLPAEAVVESEAIELRGGVEAWSTKLLEAVGQDWDQVYGGRAGLTEVGLIRNALLHGAAAYTQALADLAARRGASVSFSVGEPIRLSFALLNVFRGRMKSFCRITADGVVHIGRGTHQRP